MTPFDRRWQHLMAAARRASPTPPGAPLREPRERPRRPNDIESLVARAVSSREAWVPPGWLGWAAAACLLACALSLPWMTDALAASAPRWKPEPPTRVVSAAMWQPGWEGLAPPAPTLPALPKPPRLPMLPTLPDVHALVQSVTSEENVR